MSERFIFPASLLVARPTFGWWAMYRPNYVVVQRPFVERKDRAACSARDMVLPARIAVKKDRAAESNAGQLGAAEGMQRSLYSDLVTISFVSLNHILCWLDDYFS